MSELRRGRRNGSRTISAIWRRESRENHIAKTNTGEAGRGGRTPLWPRAKRPSTSCVPQDVPAWLTTQQNRAADSLQALTSTLKSHEWAAKVGMMTIAMLLLWQGFAPKRLRVRPRAAGGDRRGDRRRLRLEPARALRRSARQPALGGAPADAHPAQRLSVPRAARRRPRDRPHRQRRNAALRDGRRSDAHRPAHELRPRTRRPKASATRSAACSARCR